MQNCIKEVMEASDRNEVRLVHVTMRTMEALPKLTHRNPNSISSQLNKTMEVSVMSSGRMGKKQLDSALLPITFLYRREERKDAATAPLTGRASKEDAAAPV